MSLGPRAPIPATVRGWTSTGSTAPAASGGLGWAWARSPSPGMMVGFEDCGRQSVPQAPKLGRGGTLPRCPGKARCPCWDRVSRQTSVPVLSVPAHFLGTCAEAPGAPNLAGILTPPEGRRFLPRASLSVGLSCREQTPESSSSP